MRTLLATLTVTTALTFPAAAGAQLSPAGPWPAPISGATNPLVGTPFTVNGRNATATPRLRVWLPHGHSRRTVLTRQVGGRTVLRGRLAGAYDRGIAGAILQVVHEVASAPGWSMLMLTQTAPNGRFRAILPAGPTRRVAVLYWPSSTSPAPILSRRVLIRAGSRVYLRARTARRRTIRFAGHVSGAPIPPEGLLVAIQVNAGRRWPTIRLVRTLSSGRFYSRYRFRDRRAYTVRATVPRQTGWPLYAGHSQRTRLRTH